MVWLIQKVNYDANHILFLRNGSSGLAAGRFSPRCPMEAVLGFGIDAAVAGLVERFDIEPVSDFSAK